MSLPLIVPESFMLSSHYMQDHGRLERLRRRAFTQVLHNADAAQLNACMFHASHDVARTAIREFGRNMVKVAKFDIMDHMNTADLDQLSDMILTKASDWFLDRALEKRLHTIDGRHLVNALARAERLGYEAADVVEEKPDGAGPERVIPGVAAVESRRPGPVLSRMPTHSPMPTSALPPARPLGAPMPGSVMPDSVIQERPLSQPPPSSTQWINGLAACGHCDRTFKADSAFQHVSLFHILKSTCTLLTPPIST